MIDPVVPSNSHQDGNIANVKISSKNQISSKKRRSRNRRIVSRKQRKIERRVQCITDHLHSVKEELNENLVNLKEDKGTTKVLQILKGRFKTEWVEQRKRDRRFSAGVRNYVPKGVTVTHISMRDLMVEEALQKKKEEDVREKLAQEKEEAIKKLAQEKEEQRNSMIDNSCCICLDE